MLVYGELSRSFLGRSLKYVHGGHRFKYHGETMHFALTTPLPYLPPVGFDDAPHGHAEVLFKDVLVPQANLILVGRHIGTQIS
jgi:hypothetical protein